MGFVMMILNFSKDHWMVVSPVLLLLLSTLANGLIKYPLAQGLLHALMDLISATTSKDSPNTWKLPLLQRSVPPSVNHKEFRFKKPSPPVTMILLVLLLSLSWTGCCYFNGTCRSQVNKCGTDEIAKVIPNLIPLLADILMNGTGDLNQELHDLAPSLGDNGMDILRCVVSQLYGQWDAKLKSPALLAAPGMQRGHDRADAWLKAVH